jgi:hypothetical protein
MLRACGVVDWNCQRLRLYIVHNQLNHRSLTEIPILTNLKLSPNLKPSPNHNPTLMLILLQPLNCDSYGLLPPPFSYLVCEENLIAATANLSVLLGFRLYEGTTYSTLYKTH